MCSSRENTLTTLTDVWYIYIEGEMVVTGAATMVLEVASARIYSLQFNLFNQDLLIDFVHVKESSSSDRRENEVIFL